MVVALSVLIAFMAPAALVALFMTFSAVDKLINGEAAERQAYVALLRPFKNVQSHGWSGSGSGIACSNSRV